MHFIPIRLSGENVTTDSQKNNTRVVFRHNTQQNVILGK
jgi:hypothetical protein